MNANTVRRAGLAGGPVRSIAYGAPAGTESRGSYSRQDYPRRNNVEWLKHTLATWQTQIACIRRETVATGWK